MFDIVQCKAALSTKNMIDFEQKTLLPFIWQHVISSFKDLLVTGVVLGLAGTGCTNVCQSKTSRHLQATLH